MGQSKVPEGQSEDKRFFVKAMLPGIGSDRKYLLCSINGFTNTYHQVPHDWVEQKFDQNLQPDTERFTSLTSHGEDFDFGVGADHCELTKYIFHSLDRDGDGQITVQELLGACVDQKVRTAFGYLFPSMTPEQVF